MIYAVFLASFALGACGPKPQTADAAEAGADAIASDSGRTDAVVPVDVAAMDVVDDRVSVGDASAPDSRADASAPDVVIDAAPSAAVWDMAEWDRSVWQ